MSPTVSGRAKEACDAISIDSPHEVRYWTNRFEISAAQLASALAAVGSSPAAVEAWLRETRPGSVVRHDGRWTFLQTAIRNLMFFGIGVTGGIMLS